MLVALVSAKGSPGVTTLAVQLARCWPGPAVVVEADPAGGDLAARLGLAGEPNLATLAIAVRSGTEPGDLWRHAQPVPGPVRSAAGRAAAVAGPAGSAEGRSLRPAWSVLAPLLSEAASTVVVDLGRGAPGETAFDAVVPLADAVLLVTRPDLAAISHARSLVAAWGDGPRPYLAIIGSAPYRPGEVGHSVGAAVLGTIPANRAAAEAELIGQWSPGTRALRRAVARLAERLASAAPPGEGDEGHPAAGEQDRRSSGAAPEEERVPW